MESYFPEEYFYPKRVFLPIPSETPGVLNITRAIRGANKIFDRNDEGLGEQKEKKKIVFNLDFDYWEHERDFRNHVALLLHAGFELYALGAHSLYPITRADYEYCQSIQCEIKSRALPKDDVNRFLGKLKPEEVLIFDESRADHLLNKHKFIALKSSILAGRKSFAPSECYFFESAERNSSFIIQYFENHPDYAEKTTKIRLGCSFAKGEIEKLLALLPNLEYCGLLGDSFEPFLNSSKKFSALKELEISSTCWQIHPPSFADLVNAAPNLQILKLVNAVSTRKLSISSSLPFPKLQNSRVHTLVIDNIDIKGKQLSSLLCPSLVVLNLDRSVISSPLTEKKSLPALTLLSVKNAKLPLSLVRYFFESCSLKVLNFLSTEFNTDCDKVMVSSDKNAVSLLLPESLQSLSVKEDFFKHFQPEAPKSLCLNTISIDNIQNEVACFTALNALIQQMTVTDVFISIFQSKYENLTWALRATFTATTLNSAAQKVLCFKDCDENTIRLITPYFSYINLLIINNLYQPVDLYPVDPSLLPQSIMIGKDKNYRAGNDNFSAGEKKSKFVEWLYGIQNPLYPNICFSEIWGINIPCAYLQRTSFRTNASFNLAVSSGKNLYSYEYSIESGSLKIQARYPKDEQDRAVISAENLALLLQKFPTRSLKSLTLECLEITGDLSVLPNLHVENFAVKLTVLSGNSAEALWSAIACDTLTVDTSVVASLTPQKGFPLRAKTLDIESECWNGYFCRADFQDVALKIPAKYALNEHLGITHLTGGVIFPASLSIILKAFPNLRHLSAKEFNFNGWGHLKESQTQVEEIDSGSIAVINHPVGVFPRLKKISIFLSKEKTLVSLAAILTGPMPHEDYPSVLKNIHIKSLDDVPIILLVDAIEKNQVCLPPDCHVYFDSPCRLSGNEAEISAFFDDFPNFHFSQIDAEVSQTDAEKAMKALQRLEDFDPDNFQMQSSVLDPNFSQMMLVHRLHAYISLLSSKEEADIFVDKKKLFDGVCKVASKWCADTVQQGGIAAWRAKRDVIQRWHNRQQLPEQGTLLRDTLQELYEYIQKFQHAHSFEELMTEYLKNHVEGSCGITNDLKILLNSLPEKPLASPILLHNTWHTTCLFSENGKYYFFEPNAKYLEPMAFDTSDEVAAEIHRVLGRGLLVTSNKYRLFNDRDIWSTDSKLIDLFCIQGGFRFLPLYDDASEKVNISQLNTEAAAAIFEISTYHKPFWFHGLTFTLGQGLYLTNFAKLTLRFLDRYGVHVGDEKLKNRLRDGMKFLMVEDQQLVEKSLAYAKKVMPPFDAVVDFLVNGKSIPLYRDNQLIDIVLSAFKENKPSGQKITYSWLSERLAEELVPVMGENLSRRLDAKRSEKSQPVKSQKKPVKSLALSNASVVQNEKTLLIKSLFEKWNEKVVEKARCTTLAEFDAWILRLTAENLLLAMPNDGAVINFLHHLETLPEAKSRGLFVVNQPDDIQCAVRSIVVKEDGSVCIQPAPSGSFYSFLKTHTTPIIIVNWHKFKAVEPEEAHSKIEKLRETDGIKFPKDALVIVLHNEKVDSPPVFANFSNASFPADLIVPAVTLPTVVSSVNENTPKVTVELFDDALSWETFLFGRFKLKPTGFCFKQSKLLATLKTNPSSLHLTLKNPPELADFKEVLSSWISQGSLIKYGQHFSLPATTQIEIQKGYELAALIKGRLEIYEGLLASEDVFILNPTTFSYFFTNYAIDPSTKVPSILPGFLQAHKGEVMQVALTRTISLAAWAKLLTKAHKADVKLIVKLCRNVKLPNELATFVPVRSETMLPASANLPIAELIVSDDISATKARLERERIIDIVVDASELSAGQVFYALFPIGEINNSDILRLDEVVSDIWKTLMSPGKTVLLSGVFSTELVDLLAPLFKPRGGIYHNGTWEVPLGQLIVLTHPVSAFSYVANPSVRTERLDDKLQLLPKDHRLRLEQHYSENVLSACNFALLSRVATCRRLPQKPTDLLDPYLFPTGFKQDENFSLTHEEYTDFKVQRESLFFDALDDSFSLFIAGETGVGKSSFMQELAKRNDIVVFFDDIAGWLKALKEGPYEKDGTPLRYFISFTDESNLKNTHYAFFEDAYNQVPTVFYEGSNNGLDPRFKAVFAGNAKNYGGARNVPTLFMNHPNAITFSDMSNAFLYHEALLPILEDIDSPEMVARIFLKTYQQIKSTEHQAISARELQMMAYFFKAKTWPVDPIERAKLCAYQIARPLLNLSEQSIFDAWFEKEFGLISAEKVALPKSIGLPSKNFGDKKKMLLLPCHENVYALFKTFMAVRSFKQQKRDGKSSYGGLSGFFLEGENSDKLQFVKQYLFEIGFVEGILNTETLSEFNYTQAQKTVSDMSLQRFYCVSANLNLEAMMNLLNRAFHAGDVVMMNEVNVTQFKQLERLINALLMGEDLSGRRALVPGFNLIIINSKPQNEMSLAVRRRGLHAHLPDYTPNEIAKKLSYKNDYSKEDAKIFAGEFWEYNKCAANDTMLREIKFNQFTRLLKQHSFFMVLQNTTSQIAVGTGDVASSAPASLNVFVREDR